MKFGYSQHKPEPNLNSIRVQMSESEADLTKQAQPKCHFWSDPAIPVWVWPNSRGNQRLYIFLVTLDSWAAELMNSLPLRLQMSCCWHMFLYICEVVYHNYHRYRELILQENKKKEKEKKRERKSTVLPCNLAINKPWSPFIDNRKIEGSYPCMCPHKRNSGIMISTAKVLEIEACHYM